MSDSTASLISWLRYGDQSLDARHVPRALEALVRLESDLVVLSEPSEPDQVTNILHMISSVIQVEVPQDLGLTAYVCLLQPLPSHVLQAAAMEILHNHSYRTMPLPAEFLNSQAAKEWRAVTAYYPKLIANWRRRLAK